MKPLILFKTSFCRQYFYLLKLLNNSLQRDTVQLNIYAILWVSLLFCQEMMYVWNGFAIVGKRVDLTENLLVTIEKEETALQNETSK